MGSDIRELRVASCLQLFKYTHCPYRLSSSLLSAWGTAVDLVARVMSKWCFSKNNLMIMGVRHRDGR